MLYDSETLKSSPHCAVIVKCNVIGKVELVPTAVGFWISVFLVMDVVLFFLILFSVQQQLLYFVVL